MRATAARRTIEQSRSALSSVVKIATEFSQSRYTVQNPLLERLKISIVHDCEIGPMATYK